MEQFRRNQCVFVHRFHANLCCVDQNIAVSYRLSQTLLILQITHLCAAVRNLSGQLFYNSLTAGKELISAVENRNFSCTFQGSLNADSIGCTAGSQNQQLLSLHLYAVGAKVVCKTLAVCIVSDQPSVL